MFKELNLFDKLSDCLDDELIFNLEENIEANLIAAIEDGLWFELYNVFHTEINPMINIEEVDLRDFWNK